MFIPSTGSHVDANSEGSLRPSRPRPTRHSQERAAKHLLPERGRGARPACLPSRVRDGAPRDPYWIDTIVTDVNKIHHVLLGLYAPTSGFSYASASPSSYVGDGPTCTILAGQSSAFQGPVNSGAARLKPAARRVPIGRKT